MAARKTGQTGSGKTTRKAGVGSGTAGKNNGATSKKKPAAGKKAPAKKKSTAKKVSGTTTSKPKGNSSRSAKSSLKEGREEEVENIFKTDPEGNPVEVPAADPDAGTCLNGPGLDPDGMKPEDGEKVPGDLNQRKYGKTEEVLGWLEKDGYQLSKKNLYKHYGPSSPRPVKRIEKGKNKGKWFYPELLERVRINRDKSLPTDYSAVNNLSEARLRAELRIKEADARDKELSLAKKEGKLADVEDFEMAVTFAVQAIESRRKSLCSSLPAMLVGRDIREINNILEKKTKEMMNGLMLAFEEFSHGG